MSQLQSERTAKGLQKNGKEEELVSSVGVNLPGSEFHQRSKGAATPTDHSIVQSFLQDRM